jgi:uncharacterized protein (TIGR02680 family)
VSLPEPTKTRWQPLRLGLVELFRYDSEEFWFRDGHLLLRGNNGTGKSKVLSLTLPLLLDASLRSSRVEPDGDPGKKMAWNLLLGGSYERRTGYSWIEFGCLGADGQPRYLTLGLGLHAVAARAQQLEAWYFITEATAGQPRLGRDWWLISTKAPVPGREALRQLFNTGQAGAAQVFEQAHGYRRAVDERLFQLGARRYDALLDTLIQLRQPQLSRRPDEKLLSAALTESLPPLPPELLADVADALGQLEELRNELERAQRLLQAVQKFDSRYRSYAGMASRRQARGLRQAQTEFDLASRAHNEGLLRLGQAQLTEQEATQRRANAETLLHGARQRHETLLADPRHADANQLQQASANARHAEDDRVQARQRHETAQRQAEREAGLWQQAQAALQAARLRLQHSRSVLGALALQTGLPPDLHQHRYMAAPEDTLAQPIETKADEAHRRELHAWMEQRREDLRLVRRRITAAEQARDRLLPLRQALAERRADVEDAAAQHAQAEAQQAQHAQAHEEAWAEHLQQLQVLQLPDPQAVLHSLARWTQHAEGEHPGRLALHQAQAEAAAQHAQAQASLAAQKLAAETEGAALASEAQALQAGLQAPPAAPAWRGPGTRPPGLPGAPLWQLVDFAPELPAHHRAGLEAALLGAGLLDAWVTPEGTLQPAQGGAPWLDAQWLARPARHAQALSQWLQPDAAQDSAVPAATVAALLAAVACGAQDEPKAEAWVAPDGRFRLGGLAGRAELAEARHIGHAARAAARQQRLQLIQERQQALALELARLQVLAAQQQARALRAQHEWQHLPEEHTLQRAHHASAAAARALALGRQREAEAEHRCREAEAQAQAALAALLADATDLRLPNETAALESVEQALHHSVAALHELQAAVQNLQMAGPVQAQLQARAAEAQAAVAQAQAHLAEREQWAEAARTRLAAMEAAMGQSVAELQRLLARAQALVQRLQGSDKRLGEVLRGATEARAVAEQQAASAAQRLATAQTQRSQQVQALREFTATGLLASGLAGAAEASVLPDPTQPWGVDTALQLARHTEQVLAGLNDGDEAWKRSQEQVTLDLQELQRALSALNAQASAQPNNFGFVVHLQWQLKARRPDELAGLLQAEVAAQQGLLSAREQAVLENHLQAEIATQVQTLMRGAAQRLAELNAELHQHPTSTGVRFRLLWQPLPEGQGAPAGLHAARERLLQTHAGLWSGEERRAFGALLQQRIDDERRQPDAGSLHEQLTRALDYRQWHQFRVERWQDGQWRKLSGPASSGERALGLTVPLFAAVATFYSASPLAPRLILLDEAFAGIDDAARAHCMDLVRKFDLDFVITSEREWGCYATLPGVAICQLQRREGIDAVHLSRWAWDGTARRADALPGPRLPPAGTATEPELDAQP